MTQTMDFKTIKELVELKKKNPQEYKELLEGMTEVTMDLMGVAEEATKKLRENLKKELFG